MAWRTIHLTHLALIVALLIALPIIAAHSEDLRPGQKLVRVVTFTEDGTKITYEVMPELHVWHFNWPASRFPMPPAIDTARQARIDKAAEYIHRHNKSADATAVATAFVDGSSAYDPDLLWLALAVARYESSCNFKCRGYYFGAFQLDPPRVRSIRATGADPSDGLAQVVYFCKYITDRQAEGKSLRQALKPWSTRDRALKESRRIKESQ